jgi:hypothetical protein
MRWAIAFAIGLLLAPTLAHAQARKVDVPRSEQTIGSWVLSCASDPMTDAQTCRLRHKLWLVVPGAGHPGLALEVQQRGAQLVPAITVRDLSFSTALSGLLTLTATAQVRFDSEPMLELPCSLEGTTVMCVPSQTDSARAASALAKAHTVLVRFRSFGNLPLAVPDDTLALDLDGTQDALVRFRVAGPAPEPSSTGFSQGVTDTVDRLLRRLGVGGDEGQGAAKPQ